VINRTIASELSDMARADQTLRASLVERGELFGAYHPEMRALHEANATRLAAIIETIGWPTKERVGLEASEAAWLIAQHAISKPPVMRAALAALQHESGQGRASKTHVAYLEDRIAVLEGRGQRYGTQFDWNDDGQMVPQQLDDPANVDARRAAVGLGPLASKLEDMRKGMAKDGEKPPADLKAYRAAAAAFAVEVGWRTSP
jgi:hypothetical protein